MSVCVTDQRCPACGRWCDDRHRCQVPRIVAALGLEPSACDQVFIRWLAGCDPDTVTDFCDLVRRSRAAAVTEAQQP